MTKEEQVGKGISQGAQLITNKITSLVDKLTNFIFNLSWIEWAFITISIITILIFIWLVKKFEHYKKIKENSTYTKFKHSFRKF